MNIAFPVQIGNDDDPFFIVVVVQKPSEALPSVSPARLLDNPNSYLGVSQMIKLPKPSSAPITHCINKGTRQEKSL